MFLFMSGLPLLSSINEVVSFIQQYSVDVVTSSETSLDETVTDLKMCSGLYNLFIYINYQKG